MAGKPYPAEIHPQRTSVLVKALSDGIANDLNLAFSRTLGAVERMGKEFWQTFALISRAGSPRCAVDRDPQTSARQYRRGNTFWDHDVSDAGVGLSLRLSHGLTEAAHDQNDAGSPSHVPLAAHLLDVFDVHFLC